MASATVMEIVRQAEVLAPEEQLHLIALLADKAQHAYRQASRRRKWRDICGVAPYPLAGADAQAWVSRSRQENDMVREQRWSRTP